MSKVITFSRVFPKHHPKAGQPTYFVEKIYKSLFIMKVVPEEIAKDYNFKFMNDINCKAKHHTIRAGNRWKVGDKFSPRVWSGKPYCSKQVVLCDDLVINQVYHISISRPHDWEYDIYINGQKWAFNHATQLAENDGLRLADFLDWFNIPVGSVFDGQIICWWPNTPQYPKTPDHIYKAF